MNVEKDERQLQQCVAASARRRDIDGIDGMAASKREAWGDSGFAKVAPCAFAAGVAVSTGVLRRVGDKHYATDVLVGWAVGGFLGYFETLSPAGWLTFAIDSHKRSNPVRGAVLPYRAGDAVGAQLAVSY